MNAKKITTCALTLLVMALAIAIFVWQQIDLRQAMDLLCPNAATIRHWRWDALVSSVFLHGDFLHIAFNLCWIWIFGRALEAELGKGFWLLLFLTCAIVASAAELAWSDQVGIGLSGVVYGWFGFIWFTRSKYPAFHRVLDRRNALWLAGWLVYCFVLTQAGAMNVANGAHVGGLIAGSLVGLAAVRSIRRALLASVALIAFALATVLYTPWAASYNVNAAFDAYKEGDYTRAHEYADRVLLSDSPLKYWAIFFSIELFGKEGNPARAAAVFEGNASQYAEDAYFLNGYAWILATSPVDQVRDGKKAVEFAAKAVKLSGEKEPGILDTLAASYAETGDFDSAIKFQARAVAGLPKDKEVSDRLELYREKKPFRDLRQ